MCLCVLAQGISLLAAPIIVRAEKAQSDLRVSWNSVPNTYYRVVSKPLNGISSGLWEAVSDPILADGATAWTNLPISLTGGRLFGVLEDQDGVSVLLPPAQTPVLWDETNVLVIARSLPGDLPIEMISLFEVTDTATNLIGSVSGTNLTQALFTFDTAYLAGGPQSLMAVAYTGSNPGADDSVEYASAPKSVIVTNGIWFPPNSPTSVGFKLVTTFGTAAASGTYGVDVWFYNEASDQWWNYATVTGDLSERDAEGYITISDDWVYDPSIGDYRQRDPYDSYVDEGIDNIYVEIAVTNASMVMLAKAPYPPPPKPTGPPPKPIYRKPFEGKTLTRWVWRISSVVEDRNTLPLHEDSLDRQILDGMMESMYLSLAYVSPHWNFVTLQMNQNQFPGDNGWNHLNGPNEWKRFAYAIAMRYSPGGYPVNPPPLITHLFTFSHGGPRGLYSGLGGVGLGNSLTDWVLSGMGFQKTNGLTYAFFDACSVFEGGAALPNLVLVNGGNSGEITLAKLIKKGLYPHYACGWDSTKFIGLFAGNTLNTDHVDYVVAYAGYLFDPDPATGWPRYTYEEVRARAVKLPGSTSDRPSASRSWAQVGCKECKVYY